MVTASPVWSPQWVLNKMTCCSPFPRVNLHRGWHSSRMMFGGMKLLILLLLLLGLKEKIYSWRLNLPSSGAKMSRRSWINGKFKIVIRLSGITLRVRILLLPLLWVIDLKLINASTSLNPLLRKVACQSIIKVLFLKIWAVNRLGFPVRISKDTNKK